MLLWPPTVPRRRRSPKDLRESSSQDPLVDFDNEIQIMDDDLTQRNGYGAAAADITRSCWDCGKVVATTLDDFDGATKHQVASSRVKALV